MHKNSSNIEEMKKYLKRNLKRKIKITTSLVCLFLMTNIISESKWIAVSKGKILNDGDGSTPEWSIALNPNKNKTDNVNGDHVAEKSVTIGVGAKTKDKDNQFDGIEGVAIGYDAGALAKKSVAIGANSQSKAEGSIAIGYNAISEKGQSVIIGYGAEGKLGIQATAIGTNAKADGDSSVAVGHETHVSIDEYGLREEMGKDFERYKRENNPIIYDPTTGKKFNDAEDFKKYYIADEKHLKEGYEFNKDLGGGNVQVYRDKGPAAAQGVAIGSRAVSTEQAVSLGNDTYALGRSSIAIGNDDNALYRQHISAYDYEKYFKKLYDKLSNEKSNYKYGYANKGKGEQINPGEWIREQDRERATATVDSHVNNRRYSPTLAAGHGSIAIGSRSLAYGTGSTAFGTMAFALKYGSTAIGSETRAEGIGAIAVGRKTNVFSDNSVSIGNDTTVLNEGGMAYGYKAYSGGEGSIAIGTEVYSNVDIDYKKDFEVKGGPVNGSISTKKVYVHDGGDDKNWDSIYKFDLNGVANVFRDETPEEKKKREAAGGPKGWLNSGDYFSPYNGQKKTYIEKLEDALTAKKDGKRVSAWTNTELHNGVKDVVKKSGKNSIVIGSLSAANGNNSLALGRGAFGRADNAFAIGSYSYAYKENSMAFGVASRALAKNSLAFGTGSGVDVESDYSLSVGSGAVVKKRAKNALALGSQTRVEDGATSAMAIGNYAYANMKNSVALGVESKTDYSVEFLAKPGWVPRGVLSIPTTEKIGVISVGKRGGERRIVNVASGYRDSDAANVGQLRALEDKINQSGILDLADGNIDNGIHYLSINKEGDRSSEIKNIMQKQKDYQDYVEHKSKYLEALARKSKGDKLPEDYINKLKTKVTELENKNISQIASSKLKAIQENTIFQESKVSYFDKDGKKVIKEGEKYFKTDNSGNKSTEITDQTEKTLITQSYDDTKDFDTKMSEIYTAKISDKYEDDKETIKNILTQDEKTKIDNSNYTNKGAKGKDSIAVGYETTATGEKGIAIGTGDKRNADLDINESNKTDRTKQEKKNNAIRSNDNHFTKAGTSAVAIGTGAVAEDWSIAIGGNTNSGDTSIAIGDRSKAIGKTSIALGHKAVTGKYYEFNAKKKLNETMGTTAVNHDVIEAVGYDKVDNAVAIGTKAVATSNNSIAIGSEAITGDNDFTKAKEEDASTLSENTYSAIKNKKQLLHKYTVNAGAENAVALGNKAHAKKNNSVALGMEAKANAENSLALGKGAKVEDGKDNGIAIGQGAISKHNDSIAIGNGSEAVKSANAGYLTNTAHTEGKTFSIGKTGNLRRITGVADGSADSDAVTVAQLKKLEEKGLTDNRKITLTGNTRGASTEDVKVGLSDSLEIIAEDHWNFNKTNNSVANTEDKYDSKNLSTFYRTKNGKKQILIGMKETPEFKNIILGSGTTKLTIGADNSGNMTLGSKRITGLANATADTDAVAYGQVKTPFKVEADNANSIDVNLGENFEITGRMTDSNKPEGWNVSGTTDQASGISKDGRYVTDNVETYVKRNGNKTSVLVGIKETPTFKDLTLKSRDENTNKTHSVKFTATENSLTLNNKKISGVEDGNIATNSKDVVNGNQLNNFVKEIVGDTDITATKTASTDGGQKYTLALSQDLKNKITSIENKADKTDLNSYAKKDASNITTDENKGKWRTALDVYQKSEVDKKVNEAKEKVVSTNSNQIEVKEENGTAGAGKTYKIGLAQDLVTKINQIDNFNNTVNNINNKLNNKLEDVTLNSSDNSVEITTTSTNGTNKTKTFDLKVKTDGTVAENDNKAVSGKTVYNYFKTEINNSLGEYAKKDLTNIDNTGKENIKKLVNVSKDNLTGDENLVEISGGNETNGEAKNYKLSVKKSVVTKIANDEAKKFVTDSVEVSSTDGGITVEKDTKTSNKINYKLTLNANKIKELADTTNIETTYAKVDGSNLTGLDEAKKEAWATGIGKTTITNDPKNILVTEMAVKNYVDNKGLTFKSDFGNQTVNLGGTVSILGVDTENGNQVNKEWNHYRDQSKKDNKEDYTTENVMTKTENNGRIFIGLKKNPNFTSVKINDKSSIEQTTKKDGTTSLDLTYDGAKLSITKDNDKVKLSGLKDNLTADKLSSNYGEAGIAATQKEVKALQTDLEEKIIANKGSIEEVEATGNDNPITVTPTDTATGKKFSLNLDKTKAVVKLSEGADIVNANSTSPNLVTDVQVKSALETAKETVEGNNYIEVTPKAGTNGKGQTFTVGLNTATKNKIDGIGTGTISDTEETRDKTVTGEKVYNAIKTSKVKVEEATGEDIVKVTKTEGSGIASDTYKLSIDKNKVKDTARTSIEVKEEENSAIKVEKVQDETSHKDTYTVKLDNTKLKNIVSEEFAKKDASNLDKDNDNTNRDKWINKLGTNKINETITENSANGKLTTEKAVKDYVKDEITKVNTAVASTKLKLSNGTTIKELNIKDETLELASGTNTTVSLEKEASNKKAIFKVNLADELTNIKSISNETTKIQLGTNSITFNTKLTGLLDGDIKENSKDAVTGGQLKTELDKKVDSSTYNTKITEINNNINNKVDKTDLNKYAKVGLDNIDDSGKKVIKKLVNVTKETFTNNSDENILELTTENDNDVNANAKNYKLSVKKSKIQEIAKGSVEVTSDGTDSGIKVTTDTSNNDKTVYKLKLDATKVKELAGTTDIDNTYAKKDGSNLTNLTEEHKNKWADGIGVNSIDISRDADTKNNKLVTGKAVTDYVKSQKLNFKTDLGNQEKTLGETIDIIGGESKNFDWTYKKDQSQATGTEYSSKNVSTKIEDGKVLIGIKKNVEFDSLKIKDKSSIAQTDSSLDLTYDGAKLSITKDNDKVKLSGLKDNIKNGNELSDDYGNEDGIVATQKELKALLNKLKNAESSIGTGKDGRDGKDGNSGMGKDGLTGKDGLNGKDLTTKVNALRDGEAGIVVYTDKDGNRLTKANDGKYYKSNLVKEDGSLKTKEENGGNTVSASDEVRATLVNSDGTTNKPITALRIGNGRIEENSSDAITGHQLNALNKYLGLKLKGTKNEFDTSQDIKKLDSKTDAPKTILEALNNATENLNQGLTYKANFGSGVVTDTNRVTKKFGETLSITASNGEGAGKFDNGTSKYTGANLATYVQNGKMYIGLKEDSKFKSLTIGGTEFGAEQKDGKGKISATDDALELGHGDAKISITKAGDTNGDDKKAKITGLKDNDISSTEYGKENSGIAATQKELKDFYDKAINDNKTKLDAATLAYKASDENTSKTVALGKGLTFKVLDENNTNNKFLTAETKENGEVIYKLKTTDSIDYKHHSGTNSETEEAKKKNDSLTTEKAVVDYVAKEISDNNKKINKKIKNVTLTLTTDETNTANDKKVNLKEDKIKYANGINTKATIEQDKTNKLTTIKYDINSELKGITSISKDSNGNSTKITLGDNELSLNNKKIKGLADGDISENSTDAITGKQIYKLKNSLDNLTSKNFLTFNGNDTNEAKISLGEKLSIVGEGNETPAETAENNLTVSTDATNKKLTLKLAKNLKNLSSMTFKSGDKTTKISIDNSGDLIINRNGDTSTTNVEKIVTTKNIGSQEITYKANSDSNTKKTTLTNGFNFSNGDNTTAEVGDNGLVKFNLNKNITNIESLELTKEEKTNENGKEKTTSTKTKLITGSDGRVHVVTDTEIKENGTSEIKKGSKTTLATLDDIKEIGDKVNDGQVGTVIYTDKDGNKVTKKGDKFYILDEDGNKLEVLKENVILSSVSADGKTISPITLGNLKSALGLTKEKDGTTGGDKAAILSKLTVIKNGTTNGFSENELNSAATLRDIQFLVRTGLNFKANHGEVTKALGDTLIISGGAKLNEVKTEIADPNGGPKTEKSDNGKADFDKRFNDKNVVTYVEQDGTIKIGIKKDLEKINSLTSEEKDENGDKTRTKVTLDKDGATFKVEKVTQDNGTEKTETVGSTTKIGKDGIEITKKGETEATISIKTEKNGNGPSIDFKTNTGADGKKVGTGSISGLKDLDENSDDSMATNKKYVDDKVKKEVDKVTEKVTKNEGDITQIKTDITNINNSLDGGLNFKANGGAVKKKLGNTIGIVGGAYLNETFTQDSTSIDPPTKKSDFGAKDFKENYNSTNVATMINKDSNVEIAISKNLKNMRSFETEKDKDGNSTIVNQKGMTTENDTSKTEINSNTIKITDKTTDSKKEVEITKDKIEFKDKDGKSGITINNETKIIKGIKTGDSDDSVVSKGYVDEKIRNLNENRPFEYFEKTKDGVFDKDGKVYSAGTVFDKNGNAYKKGTVVGSDGKIYSEGTQEVEGKYFAKANNDDEKVQKAEDGKFYKASEIKDKKFIKDKDANGKELETGKWFTKDDKGNFTKETDASNKPKEAQEISALSGTELDNLKQSPSTQTKLIKGENGKFYTEDSLVGKKYDKTKKEYVDENSPEDSTKYAKGKDSSEVIIKAMPNEKAMTLGNIAEGRISKNSTDAINGGQLFNELEKKLNRDGANIDREKFAENASRGADISHPNNILVTDKQVSEHLKENYYNKTEVNQHIQNINKIIDGINNKTNEALGGNALAAALAGLNPMAYDPLRPSQLMAAVGGYKDKRAIALGLSHHFNESTMMSGGLSFGADAGVMLNVGLTHKFGDKEKIEKLPEQYQAGPMTSVYAMQNEMQQLLKENSKQEEIIAKQDKKLEEQEERIKKLEKQLNVLMNTLSK